MIRCSLILWTLGATALAYTPAAPEILAGMVMTVGRANPVEARVVREGPDGKVIEEALVVVPGRSGSSSTPPAVLDLPYSLMTLSVEELGRILPTVATGDVSVALGRLSGEVCYILKGRKERLWISKGDLLPRKVEILSGNRVGTAYLYLDMTKLSEKVSYPARTEVWRDGELVLVERLIPATAATDVP